jgi:vancomycin permeability regulator SanA
MTFRRWSFLSLGTIVTAVAGCGLIIAHVQLSHIDDITEKTFAAPTAPVAIVLGASVKEDGTASDALVDRVATAVDLYHQGKVQRLLMTGDDGKFHTDEVAAMQRLAVEAGVPARDVQVDGHGYRTYESCKRAAEVFHIQQAILVTQRFHLGRALYLCENFQIHSHGVSADRQHYRRILYFWGRDLLSSAKAWWDINVWPPKPPVDDAS